MASPSAPAKLYRPIIDSLQADIASGKYRPGDRMPPERVLVERFEVSRLTVREAMIGMEILGLVEARRGSGVYVTARPGATGASSELDIGAFELTEARRLMEGESAALAAIAATEDDIADLEHVLARMIEENAGELRDEVADRAFHLRIAQATHNEAVILVVETLWDVRHRSPLCMEMLERSRRSGVKPRIADHRAVLKAIASRDAAKARLAMRDHLGRVIDNLLTATETDAIERARAEASELRARAQRVAAG